MIQWPDLGARVTLRYRLPAGSVPPLTDAVGHLLAIDPLVRVRTKNGAVAECAPDDVVALRVLTGGPVRTAQIRELERTAAGIGAAEQVWLEGWLVRADDRPSLDVNSAVPLGFSANTDTIPAIAAWYAQRGLTPRLAIPDRLLRPPRGLESEYTEWVLVRPIGDHRRPRLAQSGLDYLRVDECDAGAIATAESQGYRAHHRTRYFRVGLGAWDTV